MKIAILGDTHFGMRNDSPVFHDLYKQFYTNTFLPHLEEHGIKTVLQLGDLFDRRKYINFHTLKLAREYFFDPLLNRDIELITLLGNHDVYYKNTLEVNSSELLLDWYPNIEIVREPTTKQFQSIEMDLIPWVCEDNEEEIKTHIKESTAEFCAGHFELQGFEMDRGMICHEGWDASNLARYEQVFSGHFHHKSSSGNILYVGTPGEIIWSDCNDPRGFHVFDTETRKLEFIENPYTIFRKISYNDDDLYLSDVQNRDFSEYKGKYVKVHVLKKNNAFLFETYIDNLVKSGAIDVTVVEDFTDINEAENNVEVDQADDTVTILDKFVDGIEIDLNKQKLKSILREVYTEALAIE